MITAKSRQPGKLRVATLIEKFMEKNPVDVVPQIRWMVGIATFTVEETQVLQSKTRFSFSNNRSNLGSDDCCLVSL